ncbi:hypothetical protein Tco_0446090 [Tanacetum coccineum]
MLPTLHLQQIPNTEVLIHSVEDRNVTNIDGKYRGYELGVLLKFHILKLLKNTQVVSEEKRLSVLQPGFFKQRYVTRYTLPLTGSSSLSVQGERIHDGAMGHHSCNNDAMKAAKSKKNRSMPSYQNVVPVYFDVWDMGDEWPITANSTATEMSEGGEVLEPLLALISLVPNTAVMS